ncbi:C-C motif chemokine 7-like [Girardinichthys multiradiatus]|uniref:C-C motif chemokine 7-like n=1 Tax=Girardinichthys multiradiatus TaxID=208333 RepID=UPI001FAD684C|nr:C-C motif chemokine 7-like [Girardinichthys multiradiatus]
MVMMKSPFVLATCLLLLSSLILQTYAKTFGPEECCFNFIVKPLSKKRVVNFRRTESLCPMEGVLFTMKNGNELCVDESQKWVKDIIKDKERNQNKGVSNSNTTASQ